MGVLNGSPIGEIIKMNIEKIEFKPILKVNKILPIEYGVSTVFYDAEVTENCKGTENNLIVAVYPEEQVEELYSDVKNYEIHIRHNRETKIYQVTLEGIVYNEWKHRRFIYTKLIEQ